MTKIRAITCRSGLFFEGSMPSRNTVLRRYEVIDGKGKVPFVVCFINICGSLQKSL